MHTGSTVPGLARKVRKVLDIKTESAEVLLSLAALSGSYHVQSSASRRQLKADIEEQGITNFEHFLSVAGDVITALDDVQSEMDALTTGCAAINAALVADRSSSADFLRESDRLQHELATSQKRSTLVQSFFKQYQLSAAEIAALQEADIGDTFFDALERVGSIHRSCRNLLSSHHHRAGLELMDAMSTYQEAAYERLCRWVQGECSSLGDMDAPEVDPRLHRAAQALRQRQVLFRYCAEEVATARHNAMFQRFITALTRGGPNGTPRPIEMNAHDPRRYLGDMLAWLHQALASERELLISLFGPDDAPHSADDHLANGHSDVPSSSALLDRVVEGVCRPLKIRIEQVLTANLPLVLCFKLSQLLAFYGRTVEQMIGSGGKLTHTLAECHHLSTTVFHDQLKARGNRLLHHKAAPPKDLAVPQQVSELLQQLRELIGTFMSAFNSSQEPRSAEAEFAPVLDALVDPAVQACNNSAALLPNMRGGRAVEPAAKHIFMLNCLAAITSVTDEQDCCESKHAILTQDIQHHLHELVDAAASEFLQRCGFTARLRRNRDQHESEWHIDLPDPSSSEGGQQVHKCMQSFLGLITQDQLPHFHQIQAPDVRQQAASELANKLDEAYTISYNGTEGYEHVKHQIEHTPAQIKTILGVAL
ncbi:hypothetical protein ABBQ32_002003 [Trebouxia sp. C0010 RCD-2024]